MAKRSVFTRKQLSRAAARRAYEDWAQDEPLGEWWDGVFSCAKEDGVKHGFEIYEIFFSGFCSQGDGASWVGDVNVAVWLEKNPSDDPLRTTLQLLAEADHVGHVAIDRGRGRYSHEHTMYSCGIMLDDMFSVTSGPLKGADLDVLANAFPKEWMQALEEEILESARDYARGIYKDLEKEHEYLIGEERFIEACEANEWLFDEDGRIM